MGGGIYQCLVIGYDLQKHDGTGAAGANILNQEHTEKEEKQVNIHYLDVEQDGDIKIQTKHQANGICFENNFSITLYRVM